MTATVRQCAVLVGGMGSRLGDLTHSVPKPLLVRAGRPFLAWLLRELCRYGVDEFLLLTGHLSEEVEKSLSEIQALLPRHVTISISREPARAGTGGAVFHARKQLHERFLLCNGDSLFDTNIAALLADAVDDGPDIIGRMLLRQVTDASRSGVVTLDGDKVTTFQQRPTVDTPGIINAGVYLFRRALVDSLSPCCSLEADILPLHAALGSLRGKIGNGYFRDIGVPDDFDRADAELRTLRGRKALFLDLGTVINTYSARYLAWTDGALDAIRHASGAGWHVFIVTNQSGVDHHEAAALNRLLDQIAEEARRHGGTIDDTRHCLPDLIRAWELDPARCVMIAPSIETTIDAAFAVGIGGRRFPGGNLLSFLGPILDHV